MKKAKKLPILDAIKAKEELRKWLVKYTMCEAQGGVVDGELQDYGWPCGTCFMGLLDMLGLDSKKKEYCDHNRDFDRANEVWRALLQIREHGAKEAKPQLPKKDRTIN